MGSFFTNVQVRVPDGIPPETFTAQARACVEDALREQGLTIVEAGGPADREVVLVSGRRWLALYDDRAEDQDETIETWAGELSRSLATDAFSVLVHDSDVLALSLFTHGRARDRFDSNPGFSGKPASKVTPVARAAKWAHLLAPDHLEAELAATFAATPVFAEQALDLLAPAIGVELSRLRTGYRYMTSDGDVPAGATRIAGVFTARPPWEERATGAPRFVSQLDVHGIEAPPRPPLAVLVGQRLHATVIAVNRGGAARGIRIEIASSSDAIDLASVEAVVKRSGRLAMDRHAAELVRSSDRYVSELPDAELQPGLAGDLHALAGASVDAMMDAMQAGQIHLNIHGVALRAGAAELAVTFLPLANPSGAWTERVAIAAVEARGAPLRATGELDPHDLDGLTGDAHTYLLVLLDEPAEKVRMHALELLGAVRAAWPKGEWHALASNERWDAGARLKVRATKPWPALEQAIRDAKHRVTAHCAPSDAHDVGETAGFEVSVGTELGAIAIWLPCETAPLLVPAVDALAATAGVVQAVLARWTVAGGSIDTPYEAAVGIHGEPTATRAWATRWLRAVGRGQLWLGAALLERAGALPGAIGLGPAVRIPVTDVAAVEQRLALLLPSDADYRAYEGSLQ